MMSSRGAASPCCGIVCGWVTPSTVSPGPAAAGAMPALFSVAVLHAGRGGAQSPPPLLCAAALRSPGASYLGRAPYSICGASPGSRGLCCLYNQGQKALLQPPCLCPSKTGRAGPGFCRKNHTSFTAVASSAAMEVTFSICAARVLVLRCPLSLFHPSTPQF